MIITTEDDEVLHKLCTNHILDKLEKFDIFLKPEKCKFYQYKVEYLGVIIGNGTVKIDPIKVQGISKWPTSQMVFFFLFELLFIVLSVAIRHVPKDYSIGQQKSTSLLVPDLDFFRENGHQNCDQGA